MYEIEKNKPIPEKNVGTTRKYPFHKMEVGDSFSFDIDAVSVHTVRSSAYAFAKKSEKNVRFSFRVVNATGTCWRVE